MAAGTFLGLISGFIASTAPTRPESIYRLVIDLNRGPYVYPKVAMASATDLPALEDADSAAVIARRGLLTSSQIFETAKKYEKKYKIKRILGPDAFSISFFRSPGEKKFDTKSPVITFNLGRSPDQASVALVERTIQSIRESLDDEINSVAQSKDYQLLEPLPNWIERQSYKVSKPTNTKWNLISWSILGFLGSTLIAACFEKANGRAYNLSTVVSEAGIIPSLVIHRDPSQILTFNSIKQLRQLLLSFEKGSKFTVCSTTSNNNLLSCLNAIKDSEAIEITLTQGPNLELEPIHVETPNSNIIVGIKLAETSVQTLKFLSKVTELQPLNNVIVILED